EDEPELRAHVTDGLAGARVPEPALDRGRRARLGEALVLRKVPGPRLVAPRRLARVGRDLAHHDLEERGLADAVGADDGDAVAAHHRQRDVVEHALDAVALADALDLDDLAARRPALRELERRMAARARGQALDLDLVDHAELALRL